MPYYETSQEWLRQSTLLLEARPTTTRITTKYHISKHLSSRPSRKSKTAAADPKTTTTTAAAPRGVLILKTYDPHSGATLKYKTTKAAEVSRLILSLGRLGRRMAGLPKESESDEVMADAPPPTAAAAAGESISRTGTPAAPEGKQAQGQGQGQGQQSGGGGGGGKGKKKRGKK